MRTMPWASCPRPSACCATPCKRAPDSVIVLNNLAQTLSDQGANEEALPFIERAVAQTGGTASPYSKAVLETRDTIRRRLA